MKQGKVFTFSVFKGGSGKTTTSTAFAGELARRGNQVLFIDTDFQCNASKLLGADTVGYATFYTALSDILNFKPNYNVTDYIQQTEHNNIDIMAAHKSLGAIIDNMFRDALLNDGKDVLKIINHIRELNKYDYIVIDTPITQTSLNLNTYIATDYLFMPLAVGMFDKSAIDDTVYFYERARTVNPSLQFVGAFINKVDKRKALTGVFTDYLEDSGLRTLQTSISASSEIDNAQWCGEVITLSSPKAKVSKQMQQLVDEIFDGGQIVSSPNIFNEQEAAINE